MLIWLQPIPSRVKQRLHEWKKRMLSLPPPHPPPPPLPYPPPTWKKGEKGETDRDKRTCRQTQRQRGLLRFSHSLSFPASQPSPTPFSFASPLPFPPTVEEFPIWWKSNTWPILDLKPGWRSKSRRPDRHWCLKLPCSVVLLCLVFVCLLLSCPYCQSRSFSSQKLYRFFAAVVNCSRDISAETVFSHEACIHESASARLWDDQTRLCLRCCCAHYDAWNKFRLHVTQC